MKKKITLTIIIFLIVSTTLILVTNKDTEIEKDGELFKNNESDFISIMLQDEDGNYEQSNITEFNPEGYHFNSHLSKCVNGSTIKYEDGSIYVKGNTSDRCYVYYDNNNFVEDLSGNGNYGKTYNIVDWDNEGLTLSNDNSTTAGFVDCGLVNYNFGTSVSMVIRLRFNSSKHPVEEFIFGNQDGGGFGISFTQSYNFVFALGTVSHGYYSTPWIFNHELNTFYTIVLTYNENKLTYYVDGKQQATMDVDNSGVSQKNLPILIGVNPDPGTHITTSVGTTYSYHGSISYTTYTDALIFDRALTDEEVANDYAYKINPTNKDDLLLWYKFN